MPEIPNGHSSTPSWPWQRIGRCRRRDGCSNAWRVFDIRPGTFGTEGVAKPALGCHCAGVVAMWEHGIAVAALPNFPSGRGRCSGNWVDWQDLTGLAFDAGRQYSPVDGTAVAEQPCLSSLWTEWWTKSFQKDAISGPGSNSGNRILD